MITKSNFVEFILGIEPDFSEAYQNHLSFMKGESSPHGVASVFSDFVGKRLKSGEYKNAAPVFHELENLLQGDNADEDIKNAVCTCFLENLLNMFTGDHEVIGKFVSLLGPESIKFCKAWDEFTGVATPGLWSNEKSKFRASKTRMSDKEAIRIISKIRMAEDKLSPELDQLVRVLEASFSGISNLLFYDRRDLTPEQILEEAKMKKSDSH